MSPLLLSVSVLQDAMLNTDAEDENKVEEGLNGGEKMNVSRTPSCFQGQEAVTEAWPSVTSTIKLKPKSWIVLDTLGVKATHSYSRLEKSDFLFSRRCDKCFSSITFEALL